ncbi:MAG: M23 family metallopeptidase [Anaerotignum sp.]|nr:M23 family metallopeptidase [Anaerotignum sp.]
MWEKKREEWLSPVEGVITSACGERVNPILGKRENHNGLDIAVAEGTAVIAVKSGKVTEVRTSATYGKLLEYETTDGYTVMYAHLSKVLVEEGEMVKQGQKVAESGNTGLSTGPHLHYSLWKGEKLLDPMDYLSAENMV